MRHRVRLPSFSSAGVSGDVSVVVSDGSVELHAGGRLSATLPRLEDQEAAVEIRELLFRMADALAQHGPACLFLLLLIICLEKEKLAVFKSGCSLSHTIFSRSISSCQSNQTSPETSSRYCMT